MTNRQWLFTENNPTGLIDWNYVDKSNHIRYAVYQMEVGEEGTPHLQGYVEFKRTVRLSYCKKLLARAHWEPRRGSRDEARAYCMKDETRVDGPYEYGTWNAEGQGNRTDMVQLKDDIVAGKPLQYILENHPGSAIRYRNNIRAFLAEQVKPRSWKTEVHILYGPTGTGKTRYVMDTYPDVFIKQNDTKWWDGYDKHETVLLDEFYGWIPFHWLLRLLDRGPVKVEVKNGQVEFVPKRIFITSNARPDHWYKNDKLAEHWPSFVRRITSWVWCPRLGEHYPYDNWDDFFQAPTVHP